MGDSEREGQGVLPLLTSSAKAGSALRTALAVSRTHVQLFRRTAGGPSAKLRKVPVSPFPDFPINVAKSVRRRDA
jgi:hypothetical protein